MVKEIKLNAENFEPDEEPYIVLNCGCEIYEGEYVYELSGKTICDDCLTEKFNQMSPYQKADFFACDVFMWKPLI